ncbi:MAG: acetoacetyl-CoA reductase [Rhodomicrobium sp.]
MSRVAVVTGGTRGIGHAISVELKMRGFRVAANYGGNDEAARKFQAETGIPIFKWDVGDYDACAAGLKAVEAQAGPVSVIVNNAGITRDAMLHRMTPEQWRDVIRVDLDSMYNMIHPVINGMRDRNYGRIINISSVNGQKGQMGQSNYSAAKAGVVGFTKALALENAKKGITVNCIAPGYVDTEMVSAVPEKVLESIIAQIPVGRLGKAEEIAKCVAFLAGDDVGFMTGATLSINGGQYLAG